LLVDVRAVIHINNLKDRIEGGIGVLSIEKAIVRMETKIEYIIKGVDEIKSEVITKVEFFYPLNCNFPCNFWLQKVRQPDTL
jgi:hypothetical protein